ncbi:hypothetical protein [Aureispira anguillae]|uniref:Uncharacterized protein n=1 Tax=Aureispira anguillae TaxID=2864201 RepID=A0A915VJW5_9BACT|nr:hypothetical protein [Aureispira anguillae]BDS09387.1 hypothetical protein AsAng_0000850 [Aureispira anguillae]
MNPTVNSGLFELINTLTPSEKRYIKQFINKSGDAKNNHVKLFNAIVKQEQYDEEKLKKKFRGTSIVKQWSRVKNYLYNYILRVLQIYYQQDEEFELYNNIQQVAILNKKGLYEDAHRLLKKTKYLAFEGGSATLLPIIAEWEMILDNLIWYNQKEKEPLDYAENNIWATDVAQNMLLFNERCIAVFANSTKKGRHLLLEKNNLKLLNQPIYASVEEAKSPMAKWFFYVAKVVLHVQISQYLEAYFNAKGCIELHHQYPLLQKYAPLTYITSLNNFVQATIDAKQWHEIPFLIQEVDNYINKHKTSSKVLYLTCIKYVAMLSANIGQGQFEEALLYTDAIETFVVENEQANDRYVKPHILLYHLVHIYLVNGRYAEALKHIEHLEGIQQVAIYTNTTRLLKLIILFEQDEVLLLPYAIRSVYRSLLKKKNLFEFERIVLNLLKTSANAASKEALKQTFSKYLEKLQKLVDTAPKAELELLVHFDYLAWMKSKVENRPLLEILKERSKELVDGYKTS